MNDVFAALWSNSQVSSEEKFEKYGRKNNKTLELRKQTMRIHMHSSAWTAEFRTEAARIIITKNLSYSVVE